MNTVTGSTDSSGALTSVGTAEKSVVIVGVKTGTPTQTVAVNTLVSIDGTTGAGAIFGDTSPIVNMVKVLIANGVTNIKGILVGGETPDYASALQATMGDQTIKCVLLDTNETTIVSDLKTHLSLAETEDMFRYAVVAPSSTVSLQADLIAYAATIDNSRIFVPGPYFIDDNSNPVAPVIVMAGLTACIMTETSDPALPMNGVLISGIGSVSRTVLSAEKKILGDNGIVVMYNDYTNGIGPKINRLVTSSSEKVWQEGTTRFIADYVLESNERMLRNNYQRTKGVARILDAIKTDVKNNLENMQALEIIENFDPTTLSVVKDPSDIYGALVNYEFDVVTPLYTVTINQHMKL